MARVNPSDIFDYLIGEKGLSENHALGILSNIKHESNYSTNANGDKGSSAGLFQHHNERKDALINHVGGDLNDWKGQIDFALSEPEGIKFTQTDFSDAGQAAHWFTSNFERPLNTAQRARQRADYAMSGVFDDLTANITNTSNLTFNNAPANSIDEAQVVSSTLPKGLPQGLTFNNTPWNSLPENVLSESDEVTMGDYAKQFGASAIEGVGGMVQTVEELGAGIANAVTGTEDYQASNPFSGVAEDIRGSMSHAAQQKMQEQVLEGDVLDPSTWKFNGDMESLGLFGAQVFGSLATWLFPIGATANTLRAARAAQKAGDIAKATKLFDKASKIGAATGAVTGGLAAGGDQASSAREEVAGVMAQMTHEQRLASIPAYQEAFTRYGDEASAIRAVENAAGQFAAITGTMMGAAEGGLIGKFAGKLKLPEIAGVGAIKNPVVRRGAGAVVGGAVEGAQEAGEKTVGQNMGANYALGNDLTDDVTRDTFADFVGGSMLGSPMGGLSASRHEKQVAADKALDLISKAKSVEEAIQLSEQAVDTPLEAVDDNDLPLGTTTEPVTQTTVEPQIEPEPTPQPTGGEALNIGGIAEGGEVIGLVEEPVEAPLSPQPEPIISAQQDQAIDSIQEMPEPMVDTSTPTMAESVRPEQFEIPPAPKPTGTTFLSRLRGLGGISIKQRSDITGESKMTNISGGYGGIFRKNAEFELQELIEDGSLDDYVPFEARSTATTRTQEDIDDAFEYLSERIRNGDRVLSYETELAIEASELYASKVEAENDTSGFSDEEVNDLLKGFSNEEIAAATDARIYEQSSSTQTTEEFATESDAGIALSREGAQGRSATATETDVSSEQAVAAEPPTEQPASNPPTNPTVEVPATTELPESNPTSDSQGTTSIDEAAISAELQELTELVEALTRNKGGIKQVRKAKAFNKTYFPAAKELYEGKAVSPNKFKNAAKAFNAEDFPDLNRQFKRLEAIATQRQQGAKAESRSNISDYQARIAQATTQEEVDAMRREIMADTSLTDSQLTSLDKSADDQIDAIDAGTLESKPDQETRGDTNPEPTRAREAEALSRYWPRQEESKPDQETETTDDANSETAEDFDLRGETREEVIEREEAREEDERETARQEAAEAREQERKEREQNAKKNVEDRPFVFGEDQETVRKDVESGTDDMFSMSQNKDDNDAPFKRSNKQNQKGKQTIARETLKNAVQEYVNAITTGWKNAPVVKVVYDMSDPSIPFEVRAYNKVQMEQGAGAPEGFLHDDTGQVFILASEIHSADDAARVLFHETLGHKGLRGLYGKDLEKVLEDVVRGKSDLVKQKASEYKLDYNDKDQRLIAAEEVLAEMAEMQPDVGYVKRAIAAIKAWLRNNVAYFKDLNMTDEEVVARYLIPARNFIKNGMYEARPSRQMQPAYSRNLPKTVTVNGKKRPTTNSEGELIYPTIEGVKNYWRWFDGNEQVGTKGTSRTETSKNLSRGGRDTKATQGEQFGLDNKGQPRKFYHGTRSDFQEFRLDRGNKKDFGWIGHGHYVTNDARLAGTYANLKHGDAEPNVMPLYIAPRNPYFASLEEKKKIMRGGKKAAEKFTKDLSAAGFDSAVLRFEDGTEEVMLISANQLKSAVGNTGAFGASSNIMFKRSKDLPKTVIIDGVERPTTNSDGEPIAGSEQEIERFYQWFGDSKAVDDDGNPLVLYHGTTADFEAFDLSKANIESDLGGGLYFSNTLDDVDNNYAGMGADLTQKIDQTAERIANDTERNYDDPDVIAEARAKYMQNDGFTMPVYVRMTNPAILGGDNETYLSYEEEYDEEYDEYGEPEGELVDLYEALRDIAYGDEFYDFDAEQVIGDIQEQFFEGAKASEIINAMKESSGLQYAVLNEDSSLASSEIIRLAFEKIGFDGFLDRTVNQKFGSERSFGQSMAGMDYDTIHFIANDPSQVKSAIGNNGNFDRYDNRIVFSRKPPVQSKLQPQWQDLAKETRLTTTIRNVQDKFIDMKHVVKAVEDTGAVLSDNLNAYLQEELYHGRTSKRVKDFIDLELQPLLDDMKEQGVDLKKFENFLWAKHAPERNDYIAEINPDQVNDDGEPNGSGMTTQEAEDYIEGLTEGERKRFEKLAKKVYAINKRSSQMLVDYGLEEQNTVNGWNEKYEFYVPLQREDMDKEMGGNGTGQGFSVRGSAVKQAFGSDLAVTNILSNIAEQREINVVRGEKNRVAAAVIGMATLYPKKGFWSIDKLPMIKQIDKTTGLMYRMVNPAYKNQDNVLVARFLNKQGRVVEKAVVFDEHNPRALHLARNLRNLESPQIEGLMGGVAAVTRYISSVNTQFNPVFGVLNIMRDFSGALLNLSSTKLAGKQKEVASHVLPAIKGIYKELRSMRAGKGRTNNEYAELFEKFQLGGGQTGYRDMYATKDDRSEKLQDLLKPDSWKKTPAREAKRIIGGWLTDYNETLENAVRLATYKVGLDTEGVSEQQALSIAKNISVNFNRKGIYSTQLGALYAFFNASLQGTARIFETLSGQAGRKILQGAATIGVMQAIWLASADFDDEEPPEFIKDRNIIIPLPFSDKKYGAIPMPLGFNMLVSIPRIITEGIIHRDRMGERALHLFEVALDSLNPLGGAGDIRNIIAPSVVDPVVDLSLNRDFSGRNIAIKEFDSRRQSAGHTRGKDSASVFGDVVSYSLNWITGGTDYTSGLLSPTPDQIDYLLGQATGGVGREALKVMQTGKSLVTGEDLPFYRVPLFGRFGGDANSQSASTSKYYSNVERIYRHDTEIRGRLADGESVAEYRRNNPETRLIAFAKTTETARRKLRDQIRKAVEDDRPVEEVKQLNKRLAKVMKRFNERYDEVLSR